MSNELGFEKIKKDTSRDYRWVFPVFFGGYVLFLCAAAAFCGIELWALGYGMAAESSKDLLAEVNADPAWELLIDEKFNDNQNEWDVEPYKDEHVMINRKIENGLYIWNYQSAEGWYFWATPYHLNTIKDFIASVEIKHTVGSLDEHFGLILRAFHDEYYLFEVTENGAVFFQLYKDEKYVTLLESTTSAIKIGEPNLITVKASGNHFVLYVNNQLVGEVEDDQLKKGHVGVVTTTNGEPGSFFQPVPISYSQIGKLQQIYPSRYEVDNFKVWGPAVENVKIGVLTPARGKLVFVSDKDGNPEIYSINTDGTKSKRLTNNAADDLSPKWSFEGDKIAFVSTRDGNPEIYVMNSDGSEITRVTNNSADDLDPAWSPDGKSIIFSSNRDENYEIYIYNLDTDTAKRITDNASEDRYPDWSSNKETILYQSEQYGVATLYTLALSTKESTRITPRLAPYGDSNADLSTSGSSLVYTTGNTENQTGIMIYHLDTKTSVDVVIASVNQSIRSVSNLFPTWSADDKQIAFVSRRDEQTDIYIISVDGKSIFRVTNTEASEWDLDWTGN